MEVGAEVVLDPAEANLAEHIKELTQGRGVDKAIDCSGAVAAQRLCIDATRRKGHIAFVGECYDELPIKASDDLIRTGLTIHSAWHYNLALFPKVMEVIQQSPVIDQLISHVLPLSEIQQAFELSASRQCAKIILKPWE